MIKINPAVNNNFKIQNNFKSNPIKNNNSISFLGQNKDVFAPSTTPTKDKSAVFEQLNQQQKEMLSRNIAQSGYAAFSKKDYSSCINLLDEASKLNPNDPQIYHAKASAQRMLKMYDEAIENYTKAIELNPKSANSINLRAITETLKAQELKDNGEDCKPMLKKALNDYSDYINLLEDSSAKDKNIKQANAFESRIKILMQTNRLDEALEDLELLLVLYEIQMESTPNDEKLIKQIGNAHHRSAKCYQIKAKYTSPGAHREAFFQKAYDEFSQAIKFVPNSANSYCERGITSLYLSDINSAIEDCRKAVKLRPETPKFYESLSKALMQSENQEEVSEGVDMLAKAIILKG